MVLALRHLDAVSRATRLRRAGRVATGIRYQHRSERGDKRPKQESDSTAPSHVNAIIALPTALPHWRGIGRVPAPAKHCDDNGRTQGNPNQNRSQHPCLVLGAERGQYEP